jgi:hypothetical protein
MDIEGRIQSECQTYEQMGAKPCQTPLKILGKWHSKLIQRPREE